MLSDCVRGQSRASGGAREPGGRGRCRNSASSRTTTAAHLASQTHLSTHGLEILSEAVAISCSCCQIVYEKRPGAMVT